MGAVLRLLGRVLGVELLARLAQRLPGRGPWVASLVLLVVVNLLPVWAVLRGTANVGDVFVVYWAENVVVWLTSIVRVATARGGGGAPATMEVNGRPTQVGPVGLAAFFALHYGIFTLVHGVFTLVIVFVAGGLTASRTAVTVLVAAIAVSHLVSLGLVWFGRGERLVVSPSQAMVAPYPRMLALHVAIIGGFFLLVGPQDGGPLASLLGPNGGVAVLCAAKTAIDLRFHLRAWRRLPRPDPARRPDDLYGGPAAA